MAVSDRRERLGDFSFDDLETGAHASHYNALARDKFPGNTLYIARSRAPIANKTERLR
jgi:hypothetical protein